MKRLVTLILLFMMPLSAAAHPGKTDRYGGHRCLKDCGQWNLYHAEYHLHDKDGNAIRITKKGRKAVRQTEPSLVSVPATTPAATTPTVSTQTVTVYRTLTTVTEENILTLNPLLFVLLILLLLLLILRVKRGREN